MATWLRLIRYASPAWREFVSILALTVAGVGLSVLRPWPLKLIVDYVLPGEPLPAPTESIARLLGASSPRLLLAGLAFATVLFFLGNWVIRLIKNYKSKGLKGRMKYALAGHVFDHLQRLSLSFHTQQPRGDLVRRVTSDTSCVSELAMSVMLPLVTALVSLLAMFAIMWQLDWFLSLISLGVVVPLALVAKLFFGPMTEREYEEKELQGEIMTLAEQTLSAIPVVQAFSREPHEDARFRALAQRTVQAHFRSMVAQLQFQVSSGTTTAIGTAAILMMGGLHVLDGSLSVGSLLIFLFYLSSVYEPLESLAFLSSAWASAEASARRISQILEIDERIEDPARPRPLPMTPGNVQIPVSFEDVTFGYEQARSVLNEVTFEIHAGETVAIVGPTGAGKSTLASTIPGREG